MNNEVMNSKKTGEYICNLRKSNGMTQLELAEKIPISRQAEEFRNNKLIYLKGNHI